MARVAPGGVSTVLLGGDETTWTTDSQALGVGSAEAVATAERRDRCAPGGASSIEFGKDSGNVPVEELLARPSPGGQETLLLGASESATVIPRGHPGGEATVLLGSENTDWITSSSSHGVGGIEAAASAVPLVRQAPGGQSSLDFGRTSEQPCVEDLLSRPSPGGPVTVALATLNPQGPTKDELLARSPPGGKDSVDFTKDVATKETVTRGPPGGAATLVLGTDDADWATNSHVHGLGTSEAVAIMESRERQAPGGASTLNLAPEVTNGLPVDAFLSRPSPGGVDSIDFTRTADPQQVVSSRASPGGVDSVDFTLAAEPPRTRINAQAPGGNSTILLGGDEADWMTNSSSVGIGSAEAAAMKEPMDRPAPGGSDSVQLLQEPCGHPTVEQLLLRPSPGGAVTLDFAKDHGAPVTSASRSAPGGATTLVLGADDGEWLTTASGLGVGGAEAVANQPHREHQAPGGTASVILGGCVDLPSQQNCERLAPGGKASINLTEEDRELTGGNNLGISVTKRPISKVHQPPGGASTLILGESNSTPSEENRVVLGEAATRAQNTSTNCSANCNSQTADHSVKDEYITRMPQAPGGNSSLVLGEVDASRVTASSNCFASGHSQNVGNFITDRPSTRLCQAPGGTSTVCLGDDGTQNENIDSTNVIKSMGKMSKENSSLPVKDCPVLVG